jgi:hypothetical protein
MDLKERIKEDTAMFTEYFKKLDSEGRLNDRLSNDGTDYDAEAEHADLIRYGRSLEDENSLSFMG